MNEKVGIAGVGALGSIVAKAFPLDGYTLHAISNLGDTSFNIPNVDFKTLAEVLIPCTYGLAKPAWRLQLSPIQFTMVPLPSKSNCTVCVRPELKKNTKKKIDNMNLFMIAVVYF